MSPKPVPWAKLEQPLPALLSRLYQRQHQILLHRPVARAGQLQGKLSRLCVGSVQHDPKPGALLYVVDDGFAHSLRGTGEATTAIHEFTHLPAVYDTPTSDFKYGNEALLLGSEHALGNANNYAMYATAVYLNCNLAA